jgi:hypothetical protein
MPTARKVEPGSAADLAPDHALPSSVAERLLLAIAELGTALCRTESAPRIDIRTQINAQAPPDAVGYRLALPHREPGVPPSFSPRQRSGTSRAFYSITPFQYPDDLRLCDGHWYRIVWIDSQGQQIRIPDGSPLPGLRFIVRIGSCLGWDVLCRLRLRHGSGSHFPGQRTNTAFEPHSASKLSCGRADITL